MLAAQGKPYFKMLHISYNWLRFAIFPLAALPLYAQPAPETLTFQQILQRDLDAAVQNWHTAYAKVKAAQTPPQWAEGYAFLAMTALHRHTRDPKYLAMAREDMLWMAQRRLLIHPFHMSPYLEAWQYIRERGVFSPSEDQTIEGQARRSLDAQDDLPDWGAHNRSVVQGSGYLRAAAILPNRPDHQKWLRFGEGLLSESWGRWSVEDAAWYQPFWLMHLLRAGEAWNRTAELMAFPTTRYYFDYYLRQLMPNGMMPDYGDAEWHDGWMWNFATLVRGGSYFRNGQYLWAAKLIYDTSVTRPLTGYHMYCAAAALGWLDPSILLVPYQPTRSEELLEDLIGKKFVFRNSGGHYLLFNYRDAGPFGRFTRDHLNQVLAAWEEKPHHGHADENSVNLLMDNGAVLLHDGGYRPYGEFFKGWRTDVFHNRIVARAGFPISGDVFDYLAQDKLYHDVRTEKVHFANLGLLDYSRTRLRDEDLGYTADRILIFVPESALAIVVDSVLLTKSGHRLFANLWHPDNILKQGDGWTVSWPPKLHIRQATWDNPHSRDLLIRFLPNPGATRAVKTTNRRYHDSQVFYEYVQGHFGEGQRLVFVTVLAPHAAGAFNEKMLDAVRILSGSNKDGRSLGLEIDTGSRKIVAGIKLDQTIGLTNLRGRPMFDYSTGALSYGPLTTDADFAFVSPGAAGGGYGFVYGIRIDYSGRTLFEQPVSKQLYQGPWGSPVADSRAKLPLYHGNW
jgi:hypothetical protein